MKYIAASSLFILLATSAVPQKDVKWTEPMAHPCFYGLKISVLNMGYQEAPKAYLWGIRITNNYRKAVTFRYRLVVGNESMSGHGVAWKLKPGATWTDGGDVFTGNMFQSSSANWKLTVSQVCFEGENCGGLNECYAECDRIQGNEYQPCDGKYDPSKNQQSADVTGTAQAPEGQKTDKGYSGTFTEWRQEGKDIKLSIGQDENGIYWKKNTNEPPVLFKNIRQGTYRYEVGTDFFIIRFESDNRISFWNNGSLLGYFTKPEEKKEPVITKAEPKKETVGQGSVFDGIWESRNPIPGRIPYTDSTYYIKTEVVNNELFVYSYPSMKKVNSLRCTGATENILVRYLKVSPARCYDYNSQSFKTVQNLFVSRECWDNNRFNCDHVCSYVQIGRRKGCHDVWGYEFVSQDEIKSVLFCCVDPYVYTNNYSGWTYKRIKK